MSWLKLKSLDFNRPSARILAALVGAVLMRFPFFSFQFAVASLQQKQPWDDHFNIACISDCRVYGELADGIDASGVFKWTYFPVWPNLIRFFKGAIAPSLSGYSAAVILSWIMGVAAGALCLWFFDRYWKQDEKIFGFGKKAWFTLFLISIYPHGHFWFQGYSEPLFVCVLIAGLLALMSERLWLGALLIGLSAIVRPQGVWLPPVFALLMVGLAARKRISWGKALAASALSGLGAVFLIAWYWCEAGDPFYYLKIQASGAYGRTFSLWGGIWSHHPRWDTAVLYLYLSLAGAVRLIRRKDLPSKFLGWATLAFTEVPLFFGGFYSYVRFLSVSLGMFMYLAEKSERSRLAEMGIVVFFLTKLAIQVYKSGYHEWVG